MWEVVGSILSCGKVYLDYFTFPIIFGGQFGGGSLGACTAKQELPGLSALHLYRHECIQMSRYRKEECSSFGTRSFVVHIKFIHALK